MVSEEAVKALEEVREVLLQRDLFMYFILSKLEVRFVDEDIVGMTDGMRIYLGRLWLDSDFGNRYATVLHELGHLLLKHVKRGRELGVEDWDLFNIAADAKVNYELVKSDGQLGRFLKLWDEYFTLKELEEDSVEELYYKLLENAEKVQGSVGVDLVDVGSVGQGNIGGEVIQEGSYDGEVDFDEWLDGEIVKSAEAVKLAGKGLSKFGKNLVSELLEPKVDWKDVVKEFVQYYGSLARTMTWYVTDRRDVSLPGYNEYDLPKLWVFIDVSFSISDDELREFLSEVAGMLDDFEEVKVVLWSDGVVGEFGVGSVQDILEMKAQYRGGTDFRPVIEEYANEVGYKDVVVVMTDGYWVADADVERLVGRRILVTTGQVVGGFDEVIEVRKRGGKNGREGGYL